MSGLRLWGWLLACGVLASCATARPLESELESCEAAPKTASFEQLCEDPRNLLALCGQDPCVVHACQEVTEFLTAGQVVPARTGGFALPGFGFGAQRNWGSSQGLPQNSQSVFIIPWRAGPRELLPSQKQLLADLEALRKKPHEQHHIYSRAFRQWFTEKGINIDAYILVLEVSEHRRIHRGPNGGPWNEAWRVFIDNNLGATPEEIHRHAGKLIYEFGLIGPITPFRR